MCYGLDNSTFIEKDIAIKLGSDLCLGGREVKAPLLDIRETRVHVPAEAIFFVIEHFKLKNNLLFLKFILDVYVHTKRIQEKTIRTHEF